MKGGQEMLSSSVACQRAGLSRERLIRKVQAGEIEGAIVDGRWKVSAKSLAQFIDRREQGETVVVGDPAT